MSGKIARIVKKFRGGVEGHANHEVPIIWLRHQAVSADLGVVLGRPIASASQCQRAGIKPGPANAISRPGEIRGRLLRSGAVSSKPIERIPC
jgi:hypothetical protein